MFGFPKSAGSNRWHDSLAGFAIAGFVAAAWYIPHTAPTVLFDRDSAEFQVLGYYPGIPHGTGYPLFIWLLKAFLYLPVGDIAYRANLFSALCAAFSAGILYGVGLLALPRDVSLAVRRISAAAGALAFAYGFTHWSQAIRAEVYALHALLCVIILLFMLLWIRSQRFGFLLAAAAVWALGLSHHRQIVSLCPPLALCLIFCDRSWMSRARIAKLVSILMGGVLLNVLLFYLLWQRDVDFDQFHRNVLAAADLHQQDPAKLKEFWSAFWFQTSGAQFSSLMFTVTLADQMKQVSLLPFRIVSEFFFIGSVLILGGFVVAWKEWRTQLLLFTWAATQLFININYSTLGVEVYYISIYVVCGIWLAQGTAILLAALEMHIRGSARTALLIGTCAVLLALNPFSAGSFRGWVVKRFPGEGRYLANATGSRPSLKGFYGALERGRAFVDFVPSNAIVFGPWPMQYVVEYVARIERGMTSLEYYERTPLARVEGKTSVLHLKKIEESIESRPVFFVGPPPPIEVQQRYRFHDTGGGLWQILPRDGSPLLTDKLQM